MTYVLWVLWFALGIVIGRFFLRVTSDDLRETWTEAYRAGVRSVMRESERGDSENPYIDAQRNVMRDEVPPRNT